MCFFSSVLNDLLDLNVLLLQNFLQLLFNLYERRIRRIQRAPSIY